MRIKTIVAGAAIALAATIGAAHAGDQFSTLEGITAVAMSPAELGAVAGEAAHISIDPKGTASFIKTTSCHAVACDTISPNFANRFPGGGLCVAGTTGSVITVQAGGPLTCIN